MTATSAEKKWFAWKYVRVLRTQPIHQKLHEIAVNVWTSHWVYIMNGFGCCSACVQRCMSSAIILPRSWNAATQFCRRAKAQPLKINASSPNSGRGPLICTIVSRLPKRRYQKIVAYAEKTEQDRCAQSAKLLLTFIIVGQLLQPPSYIQVSHSHPYRTSPTQ